MISRAAAHRGPSCHNSAGCTWGIHNSIAPDASSSSAHLRNLLNHPQAKRQISVESAAQLANESRPNEQLVGSDLGVRRAFLQCRDEELRPKFHEAGQRSSRLESEQSLFARELGASISSQFNSEATKP